MEPMTISRLPICISSNEFKRKRSHFFPISISATSTKKKSPLSSPTPQQHLNSKSCNLPTPKKTMTTETETKNAILKITRHKLAVKLIAPLFLPMAICITFKENVNKFINSISCMINFSDNPSHFLPENYAPVDELPPTHCSIINGSIPPCLIGGAYIRNGPNPQFLSSGPNHIYDGDGMLHSLLFSEDGTATFCSRYVQTYQYCLERDAGAPMMLKIFSEFRSFVGVARRLALIEKFLTRQINLGKCLGMANTSLAFFGGCLYALGEPDMPYSVQVDPVTGEISTIGRCDFEGSLEMGMTAHPKKDPITGEMFAFRYAPVPPFLTYFHFETTGNKSVDVPIFSVQQPSFSHDFAITENYAVFNDLQLVLDLMAIVSGSGAPVAFHGGKVPRLGVLPRYATDDSEIRWFDVPGFNMLHSLNAWEEEGANDETFLVLVATNMLGIEHMPEHMNHVHCCVEIIRINLDTGVVSRKPLSVRNLELGVINSSYLGRRNRYAYLAVGNPLPKISGVVKLDLSHIGTRDCVVASHNFGPSCFGGEPFFVPNDGSEEQDDGYLLSYMYNEETSESSLVVMDAHSPKLDIVAEVVLPHRVPSGFHGLFVSKAELLSQCHLS